MLDERRVIPDQMMRNASNPSETKCAEDGRGNHELLRRERHQAYKISTRNEAAGRTQTDVFSKLVVEDEWKRRRVEKKRWAERQKFEACGHLAADPSGRGAGGVVDREQNAPPTKRSPTNFNRG